MINKFDNLQKTRNPWRVFIAPANVAAAGLNLQVANRLILTSPLINKSDEKQALARVNRSGQLLKVDLQIMVAEDSTIDRIILAHRARQPITSDPFNLDGDIEVRSHAADTDVAGPASFEVEYPTKQLPMSDVGRELGIRPEEYQWDDVYNQ